MKFHPPPFKTIIARYHIILIPLVLASITIAFYWQVHNFEFVSFDDNHYVTENGHVQQGLSRDNLIWAFNLKADDQVYWHPLAWLSHMMDCQLFGLNAGAHHLMNLLFHIANVALLFLVFYFMTDSPWKSAFVAALFALHPINTDSVAWISERKNLLSTTFWMLTMLAYIRYARKPSSVRYLSVFTALVLGLLSKPMLVTLPCVLLLLDFWPLGRVDIGQKKTAAKHPNSAPMFESAGLARLFIEKIPFLALSIGTIVLSVISLQANKRLVDAVFTPMSLRIENAVISYVAYLEKLIWPAHLAVFYPFPEFIPLWQSIGAALLLITLSAPVFMQAKKSPWLTTGWLWYLGTLLPVIGLVQGGLWPAMADRWAYVPFIGIFLLIAWGVPELIPRHRLKKPVLGGSAAILLLALSIATWTQAGHWKNSQTLFDHALKVTSGNYVAHINLGTELQKQGRLIDAMHHYRQAIKISPRNADAYNNLGNCLSRQGRKIVAVQYYQHAIDIQPDFANAHFNLANALRDISKNNKAITHYLKAVAVKPNYEKAYNNLANLLLDLGRIDEAIHYYKQALLINPQYTQAQYNLANAYKKSMTTKQNIVTLPADTRHPAE